MSALGSAPVRVLIVEDSFPVADSLRMFLESDGFETRIVGNVRRALEMLEHMTFDVAVLDILLGAESVAPVARALQSKGTPLIYVSGFADADMLPAELRGHPRLDKPCDPAAVAAAVRDVLAARATTD